MPGDIKNPSAFESWIVRGLETYVPERLRMAVIDSIEAPRLSSLYQGGYDWILFEEPDIDSKVVAQKTFAQETVSGPAGVFRNLLMGLVTLVEKGSADQVKRKAGDAHAFARKQNWDDQQVVVSMLVAGAMLKEKRFNESVETYRAACNSAQRVSNSGHPGGKQLVLQSLFGEAGAHFAAGKIDQAAVCYDRAAAVAEKIPNMILAIEALRMGGFCHARIDSSEAAAERAQKALNLGARLKPEARGMTTLSLAAVDLLRLTGPDRMREMEAVREKLDSRCYSLLQILEQRAMELESNHCPEPFHEIEKEYETGKAEAERDAEQEIDALADASGQNLSDLFRRTNTLLGRNWILRSPVAFPKTLGPPYLSAAKMPTL